MQAKRIIPCLDVDDGRVVKGVKFKGIIDAGDPVELARRYNEQGADELTFLDIGASYKSRATLLDVVRSVSREVFIPLCVGGGIRSVDDMRAAMNAGADKVSVCTSALERPELLREMAEAYGSQCVVLSIDAKRDVKNDSKRDSKDDVKSEAKCDASNKRTGSVCSETQGDRWSVYSHGGRRDTGIDAIEWALRAVELGAGEILLNSIDADGTGAGYDLALTRSVIKASTVPVIASGGAGSLEQIAGVLSKDGANADAALVASLLHFGKTTITEIKKYVESGGVCVRW
ncbi:imidazole glycerol phosphate synthase subunit HisF [Spirochaetia bacterium]|nr:imidazole glycerol phosphate synthase subunit HisF [Spirochaetia bacterium]